MSELLPAPNNMDDGGNEEVDLATPVPGTHVEKPITIHTCVVVLDNGAVCGYSIYGAIGPNARKAHVRSRHPELHLTWDVHRQKHAKAQAQ
ncbi:hypothetical protein BGZ83_001064, partial [Gryganskiella cystojenkinii]